ncbi:D-alanyl-D-alanine carboxypeptidase family protein [Clostridium sp. Ade.TY]|uniref:D-alanyl-D-alanine carboxypeptidase family protein n=1 Tax=Clostridium sp. Ade.TY TaxID=1391647 RepID=UPI0004218B26|nr:D-alanyl-D-alanine carboxypeptidase family protein [Clostridium sp. Ade.TY]
MNLKKKGFLIKTMVIVFAMYLLSPLGLVKSFADTQLPNDPKITAKYAITMDLKTGEVIYSKNANAKAYPASITKLLTALVFADHAQKYDKIKFTQDAKAQPPYSLHSNWPGVTMKVGDTMTADDVMKGLLMFSGNDAAYMIADSVAGNVQNFAKLMNQKAQEIGMKNSHFVTPNGLHNVNHYSTAYDLALLTKAAFANPWVKEVMGTKDATISIGGKTVNLTNRNKTLGKNGNIAGKTGTTDQAGECLATVYNRNGRDIIGVVLDSAVSADDSTRYADMDKIMDYSFAATPTVYKAAGSEVNNVKLKYKMFRFFGPEKTIEAPVTLSEDVKLYPNSFNEENAKISLTSNDDNAWSVASDDNLTLTLSVKEYTQSLKGSIGISTFTLIKANILAYLGIILGIVIVVLLIIFIIRIINKRRYNKRRYGSNYSYGRSYKKRFRR